MVLDLSINLLAAFIGAGVAWGWSQMRRYWTLRRGAAFFGLEPGANCRIVIGRYREMPASSSRDIGAMIEALSAIQRFQPGIEGIDSDTPQPVGDMTEFCIGGPDSNPRTEAHLRTYLTGIEARSVEDEGHRLEIRTVQNRFKYERGRVEYAVLARIIPSTTAKPLFLICGQTAQANRGALYFLRQHYDAHLRWRFRLQQFCLVIRIPSSFAYGYKMAEIAEDATETAFSGASAAT